MPQTNVIWPGVDDSEGRAYTGRFFVHGNLLRNGSPSGILSPYMSARRRGTSWKLLLLAALYLRGYRIGGHLWSSMSVFILREVLMMWRLRLVRWSRGFWASSIVPRRSPLDSLADEKSLTTSYTWGKRFKTVKFIFKINLLANNNYYIATTYDYHGLISSIPLLFWNNGAKWMHSFLVGRGRAIIFHERGHKVFETSSIGQNNLCWRGASEEKLHIIFF